jgi:hypothetical protein
LLGLSGRGLGGRGAAQVLFASRCPSPTPTPTPTPTPAGHRRHPLAPAVPAAHAPPKPQPHPTPPHPTPTPQVIVDTRWYLLFLLLMLWGFACSYYTLFRNDQRPVREGDAAALGW